MKGLNDVSINFSYNDTKRFQGSYNEHNKEVLIEHTNFYNLPSTTTEEISRTIVHESFHAVVNETLNEYYNKDGTIKSDVRMPNEISKLNTVYSQYKTEMNKFKGERSERSERISQDIIEKYGKRTLEMLVNYAPSNIFEFVSVVLSEPGVIEILDGIKRKNGNSLFDNLLDALSALLNKAFPNAPKNSFSEEVLATTLNFVVNEKNATLEKNNETVLDKAISAAIVENVDINTFTYLDYVVFNDDNSQSPLNPKLKSNPFKIKCN